MNLFEYQQLAARSANYDLSYEEMAENWHYGLLGETSELVELLKKERFHKHLRDNDKLKKEMGDCAWYLSQLCELWEMDFQKVAECGYFPAGKTYYSEFDPYENYYVATEYAKASVLVFNIAWQIGCLCSDISAELFDDRQERSNITKASSLYRIYRCWEELVGLFGFSVNEVLELNITKLKARYPEKFSFEQSINRVVEDV